MYFFLHVLCPDDAVVKIFQISLLVIYSMVKNYLCFNF
ncbi:hypothetical protein DWUX_1052 [Desulfovibrio diazotrophicus]|nr:hypothetical protein DWUX_1052 [Desulfovibrio diazotrophicus]